ncbi:MAG: Mut7-C RNAse domain-containing protein, partial [Phycisphaerae bacterium]|nr:Mut7-C RNAse domain-containing protein [Phycisphaerae bacterium]
MLGGLARWLRAAGYDAEFTYGIDDRQLLHRATESGRMILSSD